MDPLEKDQTFGKPNDTLNYYKKKVELLKEEKSTFNHD